LPSVIFAARQRAIWSEDRKAAEPEAYSVPTARWLEVRVYPTADGLAGFSRDVSDRTAAEPKTDRRSEEQALVAELARP